MQRFRVVDLKAFLGLIMPNQCCHAVRKYIFGGFVGGFFLKETPTLRIAMYTCSTTILYDEQQGWQWLSRYVARC